MVRIIIKGGVWKNTEDEVLKAAIMKYGKNQWARISSLLTRKTPKQCKARWFEWLDPSIKKVDWSRDEDEKLLHMAKLMPTQWRTIGQMVGRTPAQCLERYQRLLDEAELGDEAGPTSEDVRKLRPGEMDPNPESKPARPDPIDMDEDEKEMLSEARARLANTQGKKAKRKAREKQLHDARRITNLQKKRELKNAGIEMKEKKKGKGMDYNADIPFHHPQPAGFWDVNKELLRERGEKRDLSNALMETLEGKRRVEVEEDERKKDFKKAKKKKEEGGDVVMVDESVVTARKKLVLPAPQVTEEDLQEIVKMGVSGEAARAMVEGYDTPHNFIDRSATEPRGAVRTPRFQQQDSVSNGDALKVMARNLKALTQSQTPLFGQDVVLEGEMDFTATAKGSMATPNLLGIGSETPGGKVSASTRDSMGINTPMMNAFDETPGRGRGSASGVRTSLSSMFANLPAPKNEFEVVVPEDGSFDVVAARVVDSEVLQAERMELDRIEEERVLNCRSRVVKGGLPRPVVSLSFLNGLYGEGESVEDMICREKAVLLYRDAVTYPLKGQEELEEFYPMEQLDRYLEEASVLIEEEVRRAELELLEVPELFKDFEVDYLNGGITTLPLDVEQLKAQHSVYLEMMNSKALANQKVERKLGVTLGGYIQRRKGLTKVHASSLDKLAKLRTDRMIFEGLARSEVGFVEIRRETESKEVARLSMIEQDLQDRFRQLSYEKMNR